MVLPGIVTGISRNTVKPVIDGITCGVPRKKKEETIPDTLAVPAGATKMETDTFGAGATPQGLGNLGKSKSKK